MGDKIGEQDLHQRHLFLVSLYVYGIASSHNFGIELAFDQTQKGATLPEKKPLVNIANIYFLASYQYLFLLPPDSIMVRANYRILRAEFRLLLNPRLPKLGVPKLSTLQVSH